MASSTKNRRKNSRPIVESLETRILYSVAPFGLLAEDALADAEEASAELDGIPGNGSFVTDIVFVDENVPDQQQLIDNLTATSDPSLRIYSVAADQSVDDIAEILSSHTNLSTIQFISHGTDASVMIGSSVINAATVDNLKQQLNTWGESIKPNGDILFYGCNLAESEDGKNLIAKIATLTGADIAASENLTGHFSLGGDWDLEYETGDVLEFNQALNDSTDGWESILATIRVDTPLDIVDGDTSSVANLLASKGADNSISLREAIITANSTPGDDIVLLPAGIYNIDDSTAEPTHTGDGFEGDLDITDNIIIRGETHNFADTIIDANELDRVFTITNSNTTIENITIQNGKTNDSGGGIFVDNSELTLNNIDLNSNTSTDNTGGGIHTTNTTTLEVNDSIIRQNTTGVPDSRYNGGAIHNGGTTTLNRTELSDNKGLDGGAIQSLGLLDVYDSWFHNNTAEDDGGAISNLGNTKIYGSLLQTNYSKDKGGAIHNEATTHIYNSTITHNIADDEGGALHTKDGFSEVVLSTVVYNEANDFSALGVSGGATVEVKGNIIYHNSSSNNSGDDLDSGVNSLGHNLTDSTMSGPTITDSGAAPRLETNLSNAGGFTATYKLQSDSPAINSGPATKNGLPTVDDTGAARNQIADIGAYEYPQDDKRGFVLVADNTNSKIYKADSNNGKLRSIISTSEDVLDIEIDLKNTRIYWVESTLLGFGNIYSADLDGQNIETFASGLQWPLGIALDVENEVLYVTRNATAFNGNGLNGIDAFNYDKTKIDTPVKEGNATGSAETRIGLPDDIDYDPVNEILYWSELYYDNAGIHSIDTTDNSTLPPPNDISPNIPTGLILNPDGTQHYFSYGDILYDGDGNELVDFANVKWANGSYFAPTNTIYGTDITRDQINVYNHPLGADIFTIPSGVKIDEIAVAGLTEVNSSPVLVNNNMLTMGSATTKDILQGNLNSVDPNTIDTPDQIVYTITSAPMHGNLLLSGSSTSTFTQQDINDGLVSYRFTGSAAETVDSMIFNVSDGVITSPPERFDIDVYNAPPELTLTANTVTSYQENDSAKAILDPNPLVISDPDNTHLAFAVLRVSDYQQSYEALALADTSTGITGTWDNVAGTLTLSSINATAGTHIIADYHTAIGSVTYQNTSDNPETSLRTISLTVNDGRYESKSIEQQIQISADNDQPLFINLNDNVLFTENNLPVLLEDDVRVFDPELSTNDDFNGATLTLQRNGGPNPEDFFTASGGSLLQSLDIDGNLLQDLVEGQPLLYNSIQIGAVTTNSGGLLAITFNENASNELNAIDSVGVVNHVLQSIAFGTSGVTSTAATSVVQINWLFDDGNSGVQGNGGNLAISGNTTVTITAVNDQPFFTGLNGSHTIAEGSVTTALDSDAIITDEELTHANDFNLATLTLQRNGGPDPDDIFLSAIPAVLQPLVEGADLTYNSNIIGTVTSNSNGLLVLTFNSSATNNLVNGVIQNIAYSNTNEAPPTPSESIQIDWIFNDNNIADAQGTGAAQSTTDSTSITINAVNDPPDIINLDGTSIYAFNNGTLSYALDASQTTSILDRDMPVNFDGGSLTVSTINFLPDDVIGFNTDSTVTLSNGHNDGSEVRVNGVLTGQLQNNPPDGYTILFSAGATTDRAAQLIQALEFSSTDINPGKRTVELQLNDGDGTLIGGVATSTAAIDIYLATSGSVATTEDSAYTFKALDFNFIGLSGSELHSITIDSLPPDGTLEYSNSSVAVNDVIPFTDIGNLVFIPDQDESGSPYSAFDFLINSGTAKYTMPIEVTPVNDAPLLTLTDTPQYIENGTPVLIMPNASLTDIDVNNYGGGSINIEIAPAASSQLQIGPNTNITTSGSSVLINGNPVATFTSANGSSSLTINLNNSADQTSAQTIINAIQFSNNSENPQATSNFTITVDDGDSGSVTEAGVVSIEPINDDPTNIGSTPAIQQLDEDTPSALDLSDLEIDDPDNVNQDLLIKLSTSSGGRLTAVNTAGVTIGGNATAVTLQGTLDNINNYLNTANNIVYSHPTPHFNGSDALTISVNDLGNSGTGGGTTQVLETVQIDINAINDDPINTGSLPADLIVVEDMPTNLNLSSIDLVDVDNTADATLTLHTADGLLTAESHPNVSVSHSGSALKLTGSISNLNSFLDNPVNLSYVHSTEHTEGDDKDALTVSITDHGNTGHGTGNDIELGKINIDITPVNDEPVLITDTSELSFIENQSPVQISPNLILSDIDTGQLDGVTIKLTDGFIPQQDRLAATPIGNINGIWDDTTGTLTLSGLDTVNTYQSALRAVSYENISDNPNPQNRTVSFQTTDGANSVDSQRIFSVTPVNDSPVIDLIETSDLVYTENEGEKNITNTLVINDPDTADLVSAEIQISSGYAADEDYLSLADQNGISGTFDSATGTLTLDGESSIANYQAAIRSINYSNNSDNVGSANKSVSVTISDGALESATLLRGITILPVNDAPTLKNIETTAIFYTENIGQVPFTSAITLTDADTANLLSATISISSNYVDGEDFLTFTDQNGISGVFNSGVLTLTGPSSIANYEAAIRTVQYENTSDYSANLAKSISATVNDGELDSNFVSRTINIIPVNDVPVATDIELNPLSYVENSGKVSFTNTTTPGDPDNTNLTSATIFISENYVDGEDFLTFADQNGITGNFDSGVLTLTGSSSIANYQAAIRSVQFDSISNHFAVLSKAISVTVNDGLYDSDVTTRAINIAPVNDAPLASDIEPVVLHYTENSGKVPFTSAVTLSDVDNTDLASATITISSNYIEGEDFLTFTDQNGISGVFNSGVLSLSGTSTIANYQTAIRSIEFETTSDYFAALSKTISVTIDDGALDSGSSSRTINITPVNDAPIAADIEPIALIYAENDGAVPFTNTITLTDPDYTDLVSARITISSNFTDGEDILTFTNQNGITGRFESGVLTLTGASSVANYQAAIRSIQYENTSDNPYTAARVLSVNLYDGQDDSTEIRREIIVLSINDAPVGEDKLIDWPEDTPYTFQVSDFGFSDASDSHDFSHINVHTLPTQGTLTLNNLAISELQDIDISNISQGRLVFNAAANENGDSYANWKFNVVDTGGTENNGKDTDASANQITFNISEVNDPPVAADSRIETKEDETLTFIPENFNFSDPENHTFFQLKVTSLPVQGSLTLNGFAVTAEDYISRDAIANGLLRYVPPADKHGIGYTEFTFALVDSGGTDLGGIAESGQYTMVIDVTAVNDAPSGSDRQLYSVENEPRVLALTDFGFNDVADQHQLQSVIVAPPSRGHLALYDTPLHNSTIVSATDITAGALRYYSEQSTNGSDYAKLEFRVTDNGGTLNGGNDTATLSNTLTFNVTEVVVDAIDGSLTTAEGTPYTFMESDFGYRDPDLLINFTHILIESLPPPQTGTLSYQGTDGNVVELVAGQLIPLSDITSGKLQYLPAPSINGLAASQIDFRMHNDSNVVGADKTSTLGTLTFDITAVNDRPATQSATINDSVEDTPYTLTSQHFAFDDIDAGDTLGAVIIDSVTGHGILEVSGTQVPDGQRIESALINNGELIFIPSLNSNGNDHTVVSFRVEDSAAPDAATSEAATLSFNVTPVNDPPSSIQFSPQLLIENTTDAIAGGIVAEDPDAGDTLAIEVDDDRFLIEDGQLKLRPGTTIDFETTPRLPLTLTAIDNSGETITQDVILEIQNVNEAPVPATTSSPLAGIAPFSFALPSQAFIDEDGDKLEYRATTIEDEELPEWITFNKSTQEFIIDDPGPNVTEYTVKVVASDGTLSATTFVEIALQPPLAAALPATIQTATPVVEETTTATTEPEPELEQNTEAPLADELPQAFQQKNKRATADPELPPPPEIPPTSFTILDIELIHTSTTNKPTNQATESSLIDLPSSSSTLQQRENEISEVTMSRLANQMDSSKEAMTETSQLDFQVIGTTTTMASGLSVGYIFWLLRSGTIIASVMSSLPAWRVIDPLPVLSSLEGAQDDNDTETLETMVGESEEAENDPHVDAEDGKHAA